MHVWLITPLGGKLNTYEEIPAISFVRIVSAGLFRDVYTYTVNFEGWFVIIRFFFSF